MTFIICYILKLFSFNFALKSEALKKLQMHFARVHKWRKKSQQRIDIHFNDFHFLFGYSNFLDLYNTSSQPRIKNSILRQNSFQSPCERNIFLFPNWEKIEEEFSRNRFRGDLERKGYT